MDESVNVNENPAVYGTDMEGFRATFVIEFLDPNTNVAKVEGDLNLIGTPRRKRAVEQEPLQPDVSQSQGFIVSSEQCCMSSGCNVC